MMDVRGSLALALCTCVVAVARANAQVNAAVMLGAVQYDTANDDPYFTYGIQVRYYMTPAVRAGFMGGTAHIGDPPLRDATLDGTDERMWRGAGFIELAAKPLEKTSLSIRGFLGVMHSSGVIIAPPPPNSEEFYGITDANTGLSYGGGIGLEVGPFSRLRFLGQVNLWRAAVYGGTSSDPEIILGMGVDL
jgi:hypothetical protein